LMRNWVRLQRDFADPEQFDNLLAIARFSSSAEIRRRAIELAEVIVSSAGSLLARLELTRKLLPARRAALDEVESARLKAAASLLEEAKEARWSEDDEPRCKEAISTLERILLLESAFLDPDESLASALVAEESQRMPLLLDLVQVLSTPF